MKNKKSLIYFSLTKKLNNLKFYVFKIKIEKNI